VLSLLPKKVTKERHPGSLEIPQQIQVFKALAKLAGRSNSRPLKPCFTPAVYKNKRAGF
jgi:hypothetical protein